MAAAAAAAGADRIFLMGYDYHYEGSEPGAASPLDSFDGSIRQPAIVTRPVRDARRADGARRSSGSRCTA